MHLHAVQMYVHVVSSPIALNYKSDKSIQNCDIAVEVQHRFHSRMRSVRLQGNFSCGVHLS